MEPFFVDKGEVQEQGDCQGDLGEHSDGQKEQEEFFKTKEYRQLKKLWARKIFSRTTSARRPRKSPSAEPLQSSLLRSIFSINQSSRRTMRQTLQYLGSFFFLFLGLSNHYKGGPLTNVLPHVVDDVGSNHRIPGHYW